MSSLLLLVICLAILYLRNIYAHSRFLLLDEVARNLRLLHWQDRGDVAEAREHDSRILAELRAQLPFEERIRAWLRSNPFLLGLPGQYYEETIHLGLGRGISGLRFQLEGRRNALMCLQKDTTEAEGRLFVSTGPSLSPNFYGAPDKNHKICGLTPSKKITESSLAALPNQTRLIGWSWANKYPGSPAGWVILRSA